MRPPSSGGNGNKLNAKSILTGGSSSNPKSKHFVDQASGYINHQFKTVNFYRDQVLKNKEIRNKFYNKVNVDANFCVMELKLEGFLMLQFTLIQRKDL